MKRMEAHRSRYDCCRAIQEDAGMNSMFTVGCEASMYVLTRISCEEPNSEAGQPVSSLSYPLLGEGAGCMARRASVRLSNRADQPNEHRSFGRRARELFSSGK